MALNICAVSLPVVVLQLVIYPYLSQRMSEEAYGLMLTLYSIWLVISNSLGNVLNNIRLLKNEKYKEENLCGDFNLLLGRYMLLNIVLITFFMVVYTKKISLVEIAVSLLITTFILAKAYLVVEFRMNLNYTNILLDNITQCVGLFFGALLFQLTGAWHFVYLCGFLFSFLFIISKTKLLREPLCKTPIYREVKKEADIYSVATFSKSAISYVDKLLLYPLMGGHSVSIYYTATILGKIISMVSGPITSVILSYIAKWEKGKKGIFTKILLIGFGVGIIGYFVTLLISGTVIEFLYPKWKEEVMIYLPVTTIAVLLQALNAFLNPFILKFYDIRWQVTINVISLVIYVGAALLLWNVFGLMGFCVGTVLGNLAKTVIITVLHLWKEKKEKSNNREA